MVEPNFSNTRTQAATHNTFRPFRDISCWASHSGLSARSFAGNVDGLVNSTATSSERDTSDMFGDGPGYSRSIVHLGRCENLDGCSRSFQM